jgi:alkylated DNA repair dioxygenase AlkB
VEVAAGELQLELGGALRYAPDWLDRDEADLLFRELRSGSVPWTQGTIALFGRERREPRLTAWFGDADYTYSGRTMRAAPWLAGLTSLRARVEREADAPFNAVLLNLYRDGRDSMGMHSDDEPELGRDPIVASVSLGQARTFVLQPKKRTAREGCSYEIDLGHGSLVLMLGSCQHHYRHGVPQQPARSGERINLTFRRVLAGV